MPAITSALTQGFNARRWRGVFSFKLATALFLGLLPQLTPETAGAGEPEKIPQLWMANLGSPCGASSPAIGADGTVYTTCWDGSLQALAPDGRAKWVFETGSDIKASPAVGDDGVIYFGGRDRRFHAVRPDGHEKWAVRAGAWIDSSAAIATSGAIYFGCWDNKFYALGQDGRTNWTFGTAGPIDSSPAIGRDGTIYFGSHDRNFYALNPDGTRKWNFATGGAIISSPALDTDGVIYFSSVDGEFHALNPDGKEKWHLWTGGTSASSPVIDTAGDIYVGVKDMRFAINHDGTKKWGGGTDPATGSPAVAANGTIYFPLGATLYGFGPDGSVRAFAGLENGDLSSPMIGPRGVVYAGAWRFFAVQGGTPLATSPWPVFRANPSQNGRVN